MTTTDTPSAATAPVRPPTNDELDALIVAAADAEWRHVAVLIARAVDACQAAGFVETSARDIATRIYALTAGKKLDAQGNIRRWRAGKVRGINDVVAGQAP